MYILWSMTRCIRLKSCVPLMSFTVNNGSIVLKTNMHENCSLGTFLTANSVVILIIMLIF